MNKFVFLCLIFWMVNLTETQVAKCDYKYHWTTGYKTINASYYKCGLNTRQTNYDEKLTRIDGQHESGHNDADVKWIANYKDNKLKTFSSIFCQKYPNLEVINIDNTELESIDEDSLENCKNLNNLLLYGKKIRELSENLLIRNLKLTLFWVRNNQLTTLPENLFLNQKELEHLEFQNNLINFLPSNIFRPLVKLEVLQLPNNKLQSINPEWFVTLQNLKWLGLHGNQIVEIPSKSFASLRNLERLWLGENKIKTLNSDSFDGLLNLLILSLDSNEISYLSVGVFTPLKNLQQLVLSNNKLTTIHSDSFGVLNQLAKIWFENNKINAIDEKFIDNTAVSFLNMTNNICSQLPITSASKVKLNLKKCFDNYQPKNQPQPLVQKSVKSSLSSQNLTTSCGKQVSGQGNIVGGAHVNRGDFPWNAALTKTNGQFFCGGSVVTNRKIITAAHCIQDKGSNSPTLARDMLVLLGIYDLNNPYEAGRIISSVQSINMHPDWNPQIASFDADITVLVLASEILFSASIQPICLPNTNIEVITSGYVFGYGKSEDETKIHENIPKIIEIPIHKNEDCFLTNYLLATLSSRRTFCGGTGTGTGVCNGDSGSGLIVKSGSAYYLRAIVSSSLRDGKYGCDLNAYSVFTDVTKYVDWINRISISLFK